MQIFTVALFGHREIDNLYDFERRLTPLISDLIRKKEYVSFIIGRNGEFDVCAASTIKLTRRKTRTDNNDLTLILPYPVADMEHYDKYYDSIIIPESVCGVHPKAAIGLRNRWMVEQSDLVVVNVSRNHGGAYAAMKYAKRLNKAIINLVDVSIDEYD